MKKLTFTLLLAMGIATAMAVPAKRAKRVVTIDGVPTTLTLMGDENLHYWQAENGKTYRLTADNKAQAFDLELAAKNIEYRMAPQVRDMATKNTTVEGMRRASTQNRVKYSGERRGLLILVNFADNAFTVSDDPQTLYQRAMTELNYKENGQYGSVRDYFLAQSYKQFDFVLDVAGPVTLSKEMAYYGANDDNGGHDIRPAHMVKEACQLVDDEVDFRKYDWDGDGKVEQVFVLYAGYGEAQGANGNTIWPHAWDIYSGTRTTLTLDGVTINSYACSCELQGTKGTKMDGIGTICHEFSHCFGLPDFYCTDYNHGELTMGAWDLMDTGCYNGNSFCPASYTAYERWACGWLEPTVLDEPMEIEGMRDINEEGECYVLYNQGNKNEYYFMQNIQQKGWNSSAPGHGMLVVHVDYSRTAWYNNTPNNDASHLRMTPICADNKRSTNNLAGDPYPGTSRNRALTDTSKPAAELYYKNKDGRAFMGKPIEQITESSNKISFVFDGGAITEAPEQITVSDLADDGSFTVQWQAANNAATYSLEYGVYSAGLAVPEPLLKESFHFDDPDSSIEMSLQLDDITESKGFTGTYLYQSKKGLRFGTATAKGSLVTPEIDFGNEEKITVTMVAGNYNASSTSVYVMALDAEGNEVGSSSIALASTALDTVQVTVDVKNAVRLKVVGSLRFYLTHLMVGGVAPNPYGTPIELAPTAETQITVTPEVEAAAYYVRVRSTNKFGKSSDWSNYAITANADAIAGVRETTRPTAAYTIDGRRVVNATRPGLYIVDGKKQVVK